MRSYILLVATLGPILAGAVSFPPPKPKLYNCTSCGIPYSTIDGTDLLLDIYQPQTYFPENVTGLVPAIIHIHGGAWRVGSRANVDKPLRLIPHGVAVVAIDYRLWTEVGKYGNASVTMPAQIDDVLTALRWVRKNGANYGIDTTRIGAWGESAGGHLVSLLTTKGASLGPETTLSVTVDMFGPTDLRLDGNDSYVPQSGLMGFNMTALMEHQTDPDVPWPQEMAAVAAANPITFVGPSTPPMFLAHGLNDTQVPIKNTEIFAAALRSKNVTFTFEKVPGGGHVYLNWPEEPINHAADFCLKYLLPSRELLV